MCYILQTRDVSSFMLGSTVRVIHCDNLFHSPRLPAACVNKDLENLHNTRGQARLKRAVTVTVRAVTTWIMEPALSRRRRWSRWASSGRKLEKCLCNTNTSGNAGGEWRIMNVTANVPVTNTLNIKVPCWAEKYVAFSFSVSTSKQTKKKPTRARFSNCAYSRLFYYNYKTILICVFWSAERTQDGDVMCNFSSFVVEDPTDFHYMLC